MDTIDDTLRENIFTEKKSLFEKKFQNLKLIFFQTSIWEINIYEIFCQIFSEHLKHSEKIQKFLEDYASKEKTPSKNVCTDTVVNNIISSYMDRAGSKDTVLNLNIQKDITLPIGNSDKVAILANILENALEGCMSADRRVIDLSIVSKGRKIILKCRNDCDRSLVLKDGEYIGFAGTGMNSIIDTVNRNNGDVLFTAENGIFECEIVFNYVQSPLKC